MPIQAQYPTKAICQVNIVGENLLGRCAFLSFLPMTDGDRTQCREFNRAKETIKEIKKHTNYQPNRQRQDSEEQPAY